MPARTKSPITLASPVAGVVQQLAIHTTNVILTEAQVLMVIMPQTVQIAAEVPLDNKDISFGTADQQAEIKLETFNFTRYGTVGGQVTGVTTDAVTDEKHGAILPATLALAANTFDLDSKPIRLAPRMNITVEIKPGNRQKIEYLVSPIPRTGTESLLKR